jgi:hypothetical protein
LKIIEQLIALHDPSVTKLRLITIQLFVRQHFLLLDHSLTYLSSALANSPLSAPLDCSCTAAGLILTEPQRKGGFLGLLWRQRFRAVCLANSIPYALFGDQCRNYRQIQITFDKFDNENKDGRSDDLEDLIGDAN